MGWGMGNWGGGGLHFKQYNLERKEEFQQVRWYASVFVCPGGGGEYDPAVWPGETSAVPIDTFICQFFDQPVWKRTGKRDVHSLWYGLEKHAGLQQIHWHAGALVNLSQRGRLGG